ncbi:protein kinase domain-containing protein [Luteolibacter soli]|uniref:Protein kinase n=1 Tax=Luteolibacter soli TaxID=3135280 RepID=A0ABU9AT72_9BACT
MPADPSDSPLGGLSPADLLRQGAAEDTLADGVRGGFVPPSLEELAGIFPQFEVLGLIGQGGMGAVYQVRQRELDRVVALKILPPGIGEEASFADRFAREAKALAKLNHPGIVTIHEFGRSGEFYFIVMEFVDGMNLRELLQRGRISPREALAIVPQVCDALQFAHDHGIVHRDIKPENLLIDRRGRVKVADFGLAKLIGGEPELAASGSLQGEVFLTEAGKLMGTPSYMAPEQIDRPADVDHRADIYSLGVVLYQMLTGELPGKQLEPPSRKVQLDVRLDEVVLRALEKDPELRFQQASLMKTGVEGAGGTSKPSHRFAACGRCAWLVQIAGVLLFLAGLAGVFRDPASLPSSTSGRFVSTIADDHTIEERLVPIIRKHGPHTFVSRSKDSREWTITVRHVDEDVVRDEFQQIQEAVRTEMENMLTATEVRSISSKIFNGWLLVYSRLVIPGSLMGLVGALLLLAKTPSGRGKVLGRIALGVAMLSLPASALIRWAFPMDGVGTTAAMVVVAFGFAVAGRDSREGQGALIGVWILLFTWSVTLAGTQRMMIPSFGSGWVPVSIAANGVAPVREPEPPSAPAGMRLQIRKVTDSASGELMEHLVPHGPDGQLQTEQLRVSRNVIFWEQHVEGVSLSQKSGITEFLLSLDKEGGEQLAAATGVEHGWYRLAVVIDGKLQSVSARWGNPGRRFTFSGLGYGDAWNLVRSFPTWEQDIWGTPEWQWLGLLDAGNYSEAYAALAPLASSSVTAEQWQAAMERDRKPLGEMKTRRFKVAEESKSAPGLPGGDYLILQFDSVFSNKPAAVESVILTKAGDEWKLAGYSVR